MAELSAVVRALDDELRTTAIPDYDAALNGLQLANAGTVTRVASAVDFSGATVATALAAKADLLLVHHGMFWGGAERIVGPAFERLRAAIQGGLAVYASHLPLDLHGMLGNNTLFARELGLEPDGSFGRYRTIEIGVMGSARRLTTATLFDRVKAYSAKFATTAVCTPIRADRPTSRWAIITGAGASSDSLREAVERGVDTLIVGEGPHHSAVAAGELGVAVIYAGHYASEVFGVRALGEMIGKRFDLPATFVDVPTGL
jgi:dinuclear metal center YbgI/SA1388 family protein